jgi:hypothetical protein
MHASVDLEMAQPPADRQGMHQELISRSFAYMGTSLDALQQR